MLFKDLQCSGYSAHNTVDGLFEQLIDQEEEKDFQRLLKYNREERIHYIENIGEYEAIRVYCPFCKAEIEEPEEVHVFGEEVKIRAGMNSIVLAECQLDKYVCKKCGEAAYVIDPGDLSK